MMPAQALDEMLVKLALKLIGLGVTYLFWRAVTVRRRRRNRERLVVGQLASVLSHDVPLDQGLRAAAISEDGLASTRLEGLALGISRGEALPWTMRSIFPECSGMTYSLAVLGQRTNRLPQTMALAERMLVERDSRTGTASRGSSFHAASIVAVFLVILTMIMIVIIPKYEEIFSDFGAAMPAITIKTIEFSKRIAGLAFLGAFLTICTFLVVNVLRLRERRPEEPRWASRLADTVRWFIPGLHKLQRAEGLAVAFHAMRQAVDAGLPLAEAARSAAHLDVNLYLRRHLRDFADRLTHGTNAGEAARACGLGGITAVALNAGIRAHNLPSALRYTADYHDAIVCRWWIFLRQASWPIVTLILAFIVAILALALFMPLIALIEAVAIW